MIIGNAEKNELHSLNKKNKYGNVTYEFDINDENISYAIICKQVKEKSVVLDVGCSQGIIGYTLRKILNCNVDGIDIDEGALEVSENINSYENLYNINILDDNDYKKFKKVAKKYDYIILADVLEHVYNPSLLLDRYSEFLKINGKFIISIPNIAHFDIIHNLINNKFNYAEKGLLDNTHIRFFTSDSFVEYINSLNITNTKYKFDCMKIGKTILMPEYIDEYKQNSDTIIFDDSQFVFQNIFLLTKVDVNSKVNELDKLLSKIKPLCSNEKILMVNKNKLMKLEKDKIKSDELFSNINKGDLFLLNKEDYDQYVKNTEDLIKLTNSLSWKVTKPLRIIKSIFGRRK